MAEERYGSGGRAFLNINMPNYNILDGAIEGGLDAECEYVKELRENLNFKSNLPITAKCLHFSYYVHAKSAGESSRFRLKLEIIGIFNENGIETRVSDHKENGATTQISVF